VSTRSAQELFDLVSIIFSKCDDYFSVVEAERISLLLKLNVFLWKSLITAAHTSRIVFIGFVVSLFFDDSLMIIAWLMKLINNLQIYISRMYYFFISSPPHLSGAHGCTYGCLVLYGCPRFLDPVDPRLPVVPVFRGGGGG